VSADKRLIDRLARIVGSSQVLTDPVRLDEASWDALSEGRIHPQRQPQRSLPLCVVIPDSVDQIQKVVLLANEEKIPIVPYGGGSGLMGGALSLRTGIVMDLKKMDRIVEVDKDACTVRAQAGVVLEALDKHLIEEGLMFGHDPWTLPVATVGGAISTDSLGYRGGKYGSMGDQVLGLEVVLAKGEVLRTRAVPKSSTGIDLKHIFIGGEGCFGIVTEATVRAFPLPERRSLYGLHFDSFERGFTAVQKIFAHGMRPALMDLGDKGADLSAGAVLYLAFEGTDEAVEADTYRALAICDEAQGRKLLPDEADRFWRDRHVVAQRFLQNRRARRERDSRWGRREWIHVALPASKVLAFRKAAMEILAETGVGLQESGLWTQPELFSMRLGLDETRDDRSRTILQNTVEKLLRLAQQMGGSMEYCHGVGVKLAPLMAEEHGYGLEVMRQIKTVLDPSNIMNPGKLGL
jgi:alkyldihydroxyacetonephosphate synthase